MHEKYYEPLEVQFKHFIYALIYAPLKDIIDKAGFPNVLPNTQISNLENALNKGVIQYINGVFSGKFNAKISSELRKIGARFDKKMKVFKIEVGKVPPSIRVIAAERNTYFRKFNELIKKALDKIEESLPKEIETTNIQYDKTVERTTRDFKEMYRKIEVAPEESESFVKAVSSQYSQRVKPYIKGWADNEINQLRQDVSDNALAGYRCEHLTGRIRKRYGTSKTKAEFLARQETALFMSNYRKIRFTASGVNKFKWSTSGDSRVRDDHKDLNGRIFYYSSPPVIDKATGQRGLPGQGFGCRCVDIAILETE